MSHTPNLRRLVVPVAFVALAFGACGGDETAEPGGMASSEETSTETTSKEASEKTSAKAEMTDKVAIVDFQYKPETIEVSAGTTVTWTNEDGFAHTATGDDKSFDTGNLDKGQAGTATFEKPGTFKYFCAIHNSMVGTVVVK